MPNGNMHKHENRLAKEKSPYLLQHAYNLWIGFIGLMEPLQKQKKKTHLYSFL